MVRSKEVKSPPDQTMSDTSSVEASSSQWVNIKKLMDGNIWLANRADQTKPTWYIFRLEKWYPRRSLKTTNLEDAIRLANLEYLIYLQNPESIMAKSTDRQPRRISFKAAAESWLKTVTTDRVNKEATIRKFLLPYFNSAREVTDINAINDEMIDDYKMWRRCFWFSVAGSQQRVKDRQGISINQKHGEKRYEEPDENTLNREYPTLRQILRFAHKKGYMKKFIEVKSEASNINRRPAFVGDDFNLLVRGAEQWINEASELKDSVRWKRQALLDWIMVARYVGIRPPHELMALCWRHIQLDTNQILVPEDTKTGKRTVPFSDEGQTRDRLHAMLTRRQDYAKTHGQTFSMDEPVFLLPDGSSFLDYGGMFNALLKRCSFPPRGDQIPYSPYSLRHTFATDLLSIGLTYEALSKIMGTSPKMLQKYYDQVSTGMMQDQLARLRNNVKPNENEARNFGEALRLIKPNEHDVSRLVMI